VTDKTTIAVSKDAKEKAREAKHESETWNEYLQRCTDEPPEIVELVERGTVKLEATEYQNIADELEQRLR